VDFAPTAEQLAARQAARSFVESDVLPFADQWDAAGQFPTELVRRMGSLGLLGGRVPPELGGPGFTHSAFAAVYEELGRGDASVRGFLAVHGGLVCQVIYEHGTEDQRSTWLPRLASGEAIGCYCLTEPEAGSDAAALRTTARRDANGWVLDGEKTWITNGGIADLALVFARWPDLPADKPHRQICAFLVPTDSEGFTARPMPGRPLGHRAADHAHIALDGCRIGAEAALGEPGRGFHLAMQALDHGRLGVAAGAVGLGLACLEAALEFCMARHAFGRPIAEFQMVEASLADAATDLEAARMLVQKAAWLKDQDRPSTRATAMAKLFATEAALRAAGEAVLLHGGRGYSSEYPVERHYRDIKGMQIYEGTSHIQRIVIARDLRASGIGDS
jgi:butyryl-CoA dehydrogenase